MARERQVERKREKEQRLGHATGWATLCDWISLFSLLLLPSSLETDRTHVSIYQHDLPFISYNTQCHYYCPWFYNVPSVIHPNPLKDNLLYKGASFDLVLLWQAIMQHKLTTTWLIYPHCSEQNCITSRFGSHSAVFSDRLICNLLTC